MRLLVLIRDAVHQSDSKTEKDDGPCEPTASVALGQHLALRPQGVEDGPDDSRVVRPGAGSDVLLYLAYCL